MRKRDPIERLYRGPFDPLLRVLGANLYHCRACRLQFYDLRGAASGNGASGKAEPEAPPRETVRL